MSATADASPIEGNDLTPHQVAVQGQQVRSQTPSFRPGEGPPDHPGSPICWREILPEEVGPALDALGDFLSWALTHWAFSTDQFPYDCWWQHPDVIEEVTAWWELWQGYIRNPRANIADPIAFHERTATLKQRLGQSYRGRCRHGHQPPPEMPVLVLPPTRGTGV